MSDAEAVVVYWDTSAVLSLLFKDRHSASASKWARKHGIHLLSSLAYAEACAVVFRHKRERMFADVLIVAALETLKEGPPWQRIDAPPDWRRVAMLAGKWELRGADLWHLALAKSMQEQFPELVLLSYDARLQTAAEGERLVP